MTIFPSLPAADKNTSEARFYTGYDWCLNPLLTVRETLQKLREELGRYDALQTDWQWREWKVNLHLFVCSIVFDIEDYLAWRRWTSISLGKDQPGFARIAGPLLSILNLPRTVKVQLAERNITDWARQLSHCVDRVSEVLVDAGETSPEDVMLLKANLLAVLDGLRLPEHVLARRPRLPEGYRDQDMTHEDALGLIQKFLKSHPDFDRQGEICVLGVRTAGAYFAPVVKAYLAKQGFPKATWMSLRPKEMLSKREKALLRKLASQSVRWFLIDDHPNTGATFMKVCEHLREAGAPHHLINILAPGHPVRPQWTIRELTDLGVTITRLEPEEFHKAKLLQPEAVEPLLQAYFSENGGGRIRILESPEVDAINERLAQPRLKSFQVHLKRVFEVEARTVSAEYGRSEVVLKRILGKSVGWGWLGYHAYVSGLRLGEFVPRVIGLRNGLLFTEWLDGHNLETALPQLLDDGHWTTPSPKMPDCLPAYVAERVRQLRLSEEPCFLGDMADRDFPNRTIVDELVDFFSGIYGRPMISRMKSHALRRKLQQYKSPLPTLVDGQMKPAEWVETPNGIKKVDHEHFNFIRAAMKTADSAYDLAAAILEFQLTDAEERRVLEAYVRESGDATVCRRILVNKLAYAAASMRLAAARAVLSGCRQEGEAQNQRYVFGRNFLADQMHRFGANLLFEALPDPKPNQARWSKHMFLLDLDGVYDRNLLGWGLFPHTTRSGPVALALLKEKGFSIVPCTGRSVNQTRQFCRTYALPGGIAEHGGVVLDLVNGQEHVLIDGETSGQLNRCRKSLQNLEGVFLDPGYHFSLRAYRYSKGRTMPLIPQEVKELIDRTNCDRLNHITGPDETFIIPKDINKATGLAALKRQLGGFDELTVAIGDSTPDLPLLEAVDLGYAPANCSSKIREAAANNPKIRVMSQPFQQGLLAAVNDLLARADEGSAPASRRVCERSTQPGLNGKRGQAEISPDHDVIGKLLQIAEQPVPRKILALFDWHGL